MLVWRETSCTARPATYRHDGCTATTRVCCVICRGRDVRPLSELPRGGSGASIPHVPGRRLQNGWVRLHRFRRVELQGLAISSVTLPLRSATRQPLYCIYSPKPYSCDA